ncbi:DUF4868 domain-containing protein [Aneurinibacillus sp. Ricciae_BoGa-3]|uniref:Kiwa anti-phage protein KwaB-like domain-containing protein n=1 Tax=Aneurinibacillus sp. Ricciae_BoGa-3 TaxID=3022697 RepID=UPI0023426C94|nr:Kiwa anti-phage protein KwaB-like domain-containing protein [Aneurinibacillus sp. Ricciae_BoGa-3]WCK54743.1 DUF4868 domain-containing protein [Aneurinibacillus sp. Ricciae_BoGa-3]
MDINNTNNLLYKLSEISNAQLTEIDISLSLVRKQKESDLFYQSLEISLAIEVKDWLKKHIIKSLKSLKTKGPEGEELFYVGDYNHEIKKQDQIAKYNLSKSAELKGKKDKLLAAVRNSDPLFQEKDTNFQIVKLTYQTEQVFFSFYRGAKKSSARKKAVFKNSNQFQFIDHTIVDVGGNFDFILLQDYIFILNVTNFEHAFDYRDHINKLRDENLTEIISMPFFNDERSNKSEFEKQCKTYVYSRGLAQIKPETLSALQDKFKARCNELAEIKRLAPEDPDERREYIEKFGTLWQLFEYIDVDQYKIRFNEGDNPTPLINFFADKIVKSFLTESIKVALSYE